MKLSFKPHKELIRVTYSLEGMEETLYIDENRYPEIIELPEGAQHVEVF